MLGWSINLFRVFGIQLAVHVSFLLLLAYYGYDGWRDGGIPGLGWSVGLILLFFVCVILHELGHSLTARRYGVNVPRILLLPIGGMAEFDRIPRKPSQELLITAAGPAVNFALAAVLLPFAWPVIFGEREAAEYTLENVVAQLFIANLVMGTFNLLPVFPMDGGRIFRALLAIKLPYLRATWWAVTVGKILALSFAALAAFFFNRPVSCVLFVFIYWAGDAEYRQTLRRDEEARYWTEMSRRVRELEARGTEPPAPPVILHGPN
jgi:Zn-dependent protease